MHECIEKEEVLKLVESAGSWGWSMDQLHEKIDALPAAKAAEERHGHWVEHTGEDAGFHYCSECRRDAFNYQDGEQVVEVLSDWCPHCGCHMGNPAGT